MADDKKNIGPEAEKPSRNILLKAQTWLSGQNGQGSCRKNPSSPGTKCPKVLFCGTICKIQKVFNPVVIPFNRTTGGNLIFIFLKGGFLLLASLLTGLYLCHN